jgi:hypothetical protein
VKVQLLKRNKKNLLNSSKKFSKSNIKFPCKQNSDTGRYVPETIKTVAKKGHVLASQPKESKSLRLGNNVEDYGNSKGKGTANSLQAWRGPECSRRLRLPDFKPIGLLKMVRLSALRTDCLYHQEIFLVLNSFRG